MNCFMSCIQFMICKRTPKATEKDYYVDPKIMLLGKPYFEPHKIQNKISEAEFLEMRKKMIIAGGGFLSAAKFFFVLTVLYALACTVVGIGLAVYQRAIIDDPDDFEVPLWVNIAVLVLPNILFQLFWIISGAVAAKRLRRFFDEQNQKVYSARGINWTSKGGALMYIHIKIVNPGVYNLA